jgi:cytidylate kinase
MFRVVTVAREYGSGGALIAQRLANRLGWKLLDRNLIERIAEAARVEPAVAERLDERPDPWFNSLAKALWQGGGLRGYLPGLPEAVPEMLNADVVAAISKHVVEEAAAIGNCVIVGRGSQCILGRRSDAFHVFIYAPWAEKMRRLRSHQPKLTEAEASAELASQERARAAYVRHYFHQDRFDRRLYHLMLCSSLGEDAAASIIMQAMGMLPEYSVPPDQGVRHVQ